MYIKIYNRVKKKKLESRFLWYKCIIYVNDMYFIMLIINIYGWLVFYIWYNGVWSWGERGGIKGGNCKFLIFCLFSIFKYDFDIEYLFKKLIGKIVKKKLYLEKFWIKFKLSKEKENFVNFFNNF